MLALQNFPLHSCFLALPLEGTAERQFQALQESLAGYGDVLRFQQSDTPHLTLTFWPEVLKIEYRQIVRQAQKIAASVRPLRLQVTGVGTFGPRGRERVLLLEVAFSPELAALKKRCPWTDRRPFTPHITLARVQHPQKFSVKRKRIMKLLRGAAFPIEVDRLRLYATLHGRRQTPLGDFPFTPLLQPPPADAPGVGGGRVR